jgi:hypothetical protein
MDAFLYAEDLGNDIQYREILPRATTSRGSFMIPSGSPKQAMICEIATRGEPQPLSCLSIVRYRMRFGSVVLDVEGVGDVATSPTVRRKGYASTLLRSALSRASKRVSVIFLNGIPNFYDRLGFVACWSTDTVRLPADALRSLWPDRRYRVRAWRDSDRPSACRLYNQLNQVRPATVVRMPETYPGPRPRVGSMRGEEGLVIENADSMLGYMMLTGEPHGIEQPFEIRELQTADGRAAATLLHHASERATVFGETEVAVREPVDSAAGHVLRSIGCDLHRHFNRGGGWMGLILNRFVLVRALAPELARRAGTEGADVEALATGDWIESNGDLLRLLIGYWSWRDARWAGIADHGATAELAAWFPGGGSAVLGMPFLHAVDQF